jgi:hypothetical protein
MTHSSECANKYMPWKAAQVNKAYGADAVSTVRTLAGL